MPATVNGTVAAVEFYAGSTLIGSDTSAPYSMSWNNVPAGTYSLTAVARDSAARNNAAPALHGDCVRRWRAARGWTAARIGAPA